MVILCDERTLGDSSEQQLILLARHTDLLLLPVSDPLDHALPASGLLRFGEGDAQLDVDTEDANLQHNYRDQAQARRARWQRLANKLGVPLLSLSTGQELVEQLHEHLNNLRPGKSA